METKKLELKDIVGYLPYELKMTKRFKGIDRGKLMIHLESGSTCYNHLSCSELKEYNVYPILRPLSDLYRPITHNCKEIIPIVELAKIAFSDYNWWFNSERQGAEARKRDFYWNEKYEGFQCLCSYADSDVLIENQYKLFDYLHELKIDYRGLIDAGLAIDVNTLENNPYK